MKKRIALVTGVSRKKGIGRAICLELAKQNIDIFFTYWTSYDKTMPWNVEANEQEDIQKEIKKFGVKCDKLELDLTKNQSIQILFNEVISKIGTPDILINNATYSTSTNIENITFEELDNHYNINIKATTLLISEFVKNFKSKNGRIINLTSGQSLGKMNNEFAYAMTKGAIDILTNTLSSELAYKNITINSVNPGPNDTGWMNDELKKELKDRFPMNRIGKPKDTAKLISFLVSENAEWITGQIIHSEGGFKR